MDTIKSKITLLTLAAAILFTSCNKKLELTGDNGDIAAQFTTQIYSRAVGNSWSTNDQIGIFMVKSKADLAPPYIVNNVDNIAYVTATAGVSGIFAPVNPAQTIYFPQSGDVDFISYYPYKPSLVKYTYPIDVSDQSNPEAIDLLYSNNAVAKNSANPLVAFNFKHKLSKLVIKPTSTGEYTKAEMDAMVVKIKGLNTVAEFMLAGNTLNKRSTPADITTKTVTAGALYEAIVLPIEVLTGASIEFTIAGKTITYNIKTTSFVQGNRYTYDLVLGSSSVTVGGSTIDDWEDNVEPGEKPTKTIAKTIIDILEIKYYSESANGKITKIELNEINPYTGAYVTEGFSDQISIAYAPSSVTMQGNITTNALGAIDVYGKAVPLIFNAVYTLNAAGLATSVTIETTRDNKKEIRTTTYQYNADNQLVSAIVNNSLGEKVSECTAVWEGGNLMSAIIKSKLDFDQGGVIPDPNQGTRADLPVWDEYTETYAYKTTINFGEALYPLNLPTIYYEDDVIGVFASVIGILGKGTKNLVAERIESTDYSVNFSYTFYDSGLYPQYITRSDNSNDSEEIEKVEVKRMELKFN